MDFKDIVEIAGVILASLGGGVAIVFGFSSWFGKIWANKLMEKDKAGYARDLESLKNELLLETESYKIRLKKSEIIFQKQFEAASEFVALNRSFLPPHTSPDMDWHEACDDIARNFDKIEFELNSYISKHGAVLGDNVIRLLTSAQAIAAEKKFRFSDSPFPSTDANQGADMLVKKCDSAEQLLLEMVHSQAST